MPSPQEHASGRAHVEDRLPLWTTRRLLRRELGARRGLGPGGHHRCDVPVVRNAGGTGSSLLLHVRLLATTETTIDDLSANTSSTAPPPTLPDAACVQALSLIHI